MRERRALVGGGAKLIEVDRRGDAGHQHHRAVQRDRVAERGERAEDAVAADHRDLDVLAARELDHERDHAPVRKVCALERFVDFDQHQYPGRDRRCADAGGPVRNRPQSARTRIHSVNEGLNPKQSPALRAKPVSVPGTFNMQYQNGRMIACTFIGKKIGEWAARQSAPRRDLSDLSALGDVSLRPERLFAGWKLTRRPPAEALARRCSRSHKFPCNERRGEERSSTGRDGLRAVDCGHQRRLTSQCQTVFQMLRAPSCGGFEEIRRLRRLEAVRANESRVLRAGPSSEHQPKPDNISEDGRSAANAATGRAAAIDEDNPAGNEFRRRPAHGCGTRLYTVEGRQTGDLPRKCNSALIRRQAARDREEGVPSDSDG